MERRNAAGVSAPSGETSNVKGIWLHASYALKIVSSIEKMGKYQEYWKSRNFLLRCKVLLLKQVCQVFHKSFHPFSSIFTYLHLFSNISIFDESEDRFCKFLNRIDLCFLFLLVWSRGDANIPVIMMPPFFIFTLSKYSHFSDGSSPHYWSTINPRKTCPTPYQTADVSFPKCGKCGTVVVW